MPKKTVKVERPVLVDPQDGPCELCAKHNDGVCDRCGAKKMYDKLTDHTRHIGNNGFQSPKPSHYHLSPVLGIAGREAYYDELCIDCYRKDYTAVYGTKPPL